MSFSSPPSPVRQEKPFRRHVACGRPGSMKTILLVASFVWLASSRLSKRVVCFLRKGSRVLVIIPSCVATGGVGRSSSGCVLGLKMF
ncbi:hypothetical protein NPIL_493171 [Nephila pilipes]|uniref:Uncharacterized protein n=1 Tax=Nephila pilipes TaxID=299642 RepID=A0A8X6QXT3_NEPPI|nr:hypothetical protein NPIL_493171 [Nephila pilipes]